MSVCMILSSTYLPKDPNIKNLLTGSLLSFQQ